MLANQSQRNGDCALGGRRLRSFASKLLVESLLLSPHCAMNKTQLTQLICMMLQDSDDLVVQSAASCLCEIVKHQSMTNKIGASDILSICIDLMPKSRKF